MTHQPPVPEAAQSPYPLQPAPHNDGAKLAVTPAPQNEPLVTPAVAQLASIGAAFLGSAALAAWYFRRDKKPKSAQRKPARKSNTSESTRTGTRKPRKSSDAALVASGQPYEVSYFARKHGLSTTEVREIFQEAGSSRAKANELAKSRKG